MKAIRTLLLAAGLIGAPCLWAQQPATGGPAQPPGPALTNAPAEPAIAAPKADVVEPAPTPPAAEPAMAPTNAPPELDANGEPLLRLNFRGVPLDMVLNYLSDAAGFIIVLETQLRGKVDVWSSQPLTKDEAVNLLNAVLNKNGYAAIRNDRTLTIVNKDEAKTHDVRVQLGNDPDKIPKNDEIITQIIPVRFVEVTQLLKDLQPLVSTQTPMTANESGNSIVITDTQANIRKVVEVIKAIDTGAEDVTEVKVFRLHFADPVEIADLLTSLFPEDSRSGTSSSPIQFGGGFRRFFGGGGPFGGGNQSAATSGNNQQRIKKRARVIAVADQRTASVVVTAAKDLMENISGVVAELDSDKAKNTTVSIFQFKNADPQEALPVLQDMFQKTTTQNSRNNNTQNNPFMNRTTQQNQQSSSASRNSTLGNNRGVGGGGALP